MKMKIKDKILSSTLAFLMISDLWPATASAASDPANYTFDVSSTDEPSQKSYILSVNSTVSNADLSSLALTGRP